jgi:RNA polymerase sigma-70 factor (ECF subfamily)
MLETVTSTSILNGLRDAENQTAWRLYVDRYRPLLVGFVTHMGVPPEDAEDIAQETLLAFSEAFREGRYERSQGRLKSWLFGMARNKLAHHFRSRARHPTEALEGEMTGTGQSGAEEAWDREWRRRVVEQCLSQVRSEVQPLTWRAFNPFALDDRPTQEVAEALGITRNAVFLAKSRILRRLKELLIVMEEIW